MAIEIEETFQVDAPIAKVWAFMTSPENVAACMPGASVAEILDERSFLGNIKLKVGAVTAKYQGKIAFTELDEAAHTMEMLAEGKEPGGGTVSGTITSRLKSLADGGTEVYCQSSIELTGKIMQVGRGMIQGVSQQLFKKFVTNTKKRLEVPADEAAASPATASGAGAGETATSVPQSGPVSSPVQDDDDSIAVLPLLLKALGASILNFFKGIWKAILGLFG